MIRLSYQVLDSMNSHPELLNSLHQNSGIQILKLANQDSMGTSKRDDLYKVDNIPGPGTYNTRPTNSSGPKFG